MSFITTDRCEVSSVSTEIGSASAAQVSQNPETKSTKYKNTADLKITPEAAKIQVTLLNPLSHMPN